MDVLLEIFEPQGSWIIDALRFVIFFVLSFLAIWAVELWLCRNWRVVRNNTELNIYFSWLLLFTAYGVLVTGFAVMLATFYKEEGVRSIYAVPYSAMGFLALGFSWYFNRKIARKISLEAEE